MEGHVGIGFKLPNGDEYTSKIVKKGATIGDYACLNNKFTEWRYKAVTEV
jgi:hypothetical protein